MVPVSEALRIIRETWASNGDYLDDLLDRLSSTPPIPLVPFVGAGLPIPMGFPSWSGFLRGLAAECGRSAEVEALLSKGLYEEAAETAEQGLGEAIFNKRIAHTFGDRASRECELKGAVLVLPELAGGAVVTTNLDRVLERVFIEAGSPFKQVVWGSQVDSIRQAIVDNKRFLLKIHGDAEERAGRVLTKREYDKHYAPGDPEDLQAQVGRIFQGRMLLFVGCSLEKDRTMDVLFKLIRQASGHEHLAVVEKPASDDEFFEKQRRLGGHGILPIWYPTGRHDLIEPLLRWIARLQPSGPAAEQDLVLEQPSHRKTKITSELDLLIPDQRTTALVGREKEAESLRQWAESEATVSVRVLTGAGGTGKTRLAVELIEFLEGTEPGRWNCGFLTQDEMERFSARQNLSQWRRRKPVLAVVDYAAGSAERLCLWLEQLAAGTDGGEKLRLLLLERDASPDAGWLASAIPRGYSATAARVLFDPPQPVRLENVAKAVDRRSILEATIEAAAALRGTAAPSVPAAGQDEIFDRKLTEPQWGAPLTLMMAGLTALHTRLVPAMGLGRQDLAFRLAERELDRLRRFGNGAPAGLMEHMAAYVTLSGGLSRKELGETAKAECEAIGRQHPQGWGVLADAVKEALWHENGARAVEPDVVGEALVLTAWGGAELAEGCRAVVRAARTRGSQVAASVIRSVQDFSIGEAPRQEPLDWLDALIAEAESNLVLLWQIERELPHHTAVLLDRAAKVDFLLARALPPRESRDETTRSQRAYVLSNLGNRLGALGQRDQALQATGAAYGIYHELAAQHRGAFLPEMAGSLVNLSQRLSELGRRNEALQAAQDAVSILQQIAPQLPDLFLGRLVASLDTLGNRLGDLGRLEEALRATEEAVRICRQLVSKHPGIPIGDLASPVHNLSVRLSALGRHEEALHAAKEAVSIHQSLAAENLDAALRGLASSFQILGRALLALGRLEKALAITDRAILILRRLAEQRPEAFQPDLTSALNNLGIILAGLGRREEGLHAIEEALSLSRGLASKHPGALAYNVAFSLNNLGNLLGELGQWEKANEATAEAIELYRQLSASASDVFLHELARSLSNLSKGLTALQRRSEALDAISETVRIRRQLFTQRPQLLRLDFVASLTAKARLLLEMGDQVKARSTLRELIECSKHALNHCPEPVRQQLMDSVLVYLRTGGNAKAGVGRRLFCEVARRASSCSVSISVSTRYPVLIRRTFWQRRAHPRQEGGVGAGRAKWNRLAFPRAPERWT